MELTTINGMDSREIAERTGKTHAHVCRDIQVMLEGLGVDESKFGSVYRGGNGEDRRCYILPKRECLILASGYSVALRAAIIDRWAELEAAQQFALPKSFAEALQLAADQARTIEAQAAQIVAAAPAVAFVERFVEAKSSKSLSDVAKVLGRKPRAFIDWLISEGILFRRSGSIVPFQVHLDAGRFEVKAGEEHGHAFTQTRFTPLGVEWIAKRVRFETKAA